VYGVAPIVAPSVGGLLLPLTGWRGIFVVLAAFGEMMLVGDAFGLPETLSPALRRPPHMGAMARTMVRLRDRNFLGFVLAQGFGFAAMFACISGSPFVIQEVYGASAQLYGLRNLLAVVFALELAQSPASAIPSAAPVREAQRIRESRMAARRTACAVSVGRNRGREPVTLMTATTSFAELKTGAATLARPRVDSSWS